MNGKFADFLVLYLDRAIPASSRLAKLAPGWPGNNVTMVQVGRGKHDGYDNPLKTMRYRNTRSYSASNADGHVLVEAITDSIDSGGPIFTIENGRAVVHGANWGNVFEWAMRGKYTSTSYHFYNIAKAAGNVMKHNWDYVGNDLSSIAATTPTACISECMASNTCKAYTFVPVAPLLPIGTCFLKSGTGGGGRAAAGMISGYRAATGTCTLSGGYCRL